MVLPVADGDGLAPPGGARLAEGDGCWVGTGVGESLGLPDGSGLPDPWWPGDCWPGHQIPDGRPLAVPDGEPEG